MDDEEIRLLTAADWAHQGYGVWRPRRFTGFMYRANENEVRVGVGERGVPSYTCESVQAALAVWRLFGGGQ